MCDSGHLIYSYRRFVSTQGVPYAAGELTISSGEHDFFLCIRLHEYFVVLFLGILPGDRCQKGCRIGVRSVLDRCQKGCQIDVRASCYKTKSHSGRWSDLHRSSSQLHVSRDGEPKYEVKYQRYGADVGDEDDGRHHGTSLAAFHEYTTDQGDQGGSERCCHTQNSQPSTNPQR